MDHDCWHIDFATYCRRISNEIPDADGIELTFEHPDLFSIYPSKKVVQYVNDIVSTYNFRSIAMHAPTRDVNISSYNPRIRQTSFNELIKSLELFIQIDGPKLIYFLVHGGQNSFRAPSRFSKRNLHTSLSNHIDNLIKLDKICENFGITLTIENLIYSSWRLTSKIEYLDALFDEVPNIKFAFDIDHAIFVSYSYANKMLNKYLNRINVIHIGNINIFNKFKNLLIPINPSYVFEPHSIKNKFQLFQSLNRNVKTIKNVVENFKKPEITVP